MGFIDWLMRRKLNKKKEILERERDRLSQHYYGVPYRNLCGRRKGTIDSLIKK